MDENFLVELATEGEKKFSFSIPLGMSMGDAFRNLEGTVEETIKASSDWRDPSGLRSLIAVEAMSWREIFRQSLGAMGGEEAGMSPLNDDGNADKLLGLLASGNKLMKHFFIQGRMKDDAIEMYFVFRIEAGPRFISSVDFG